MIRYRVLVPGRVQGVFFRDTCRRVAQQHGVSGWVRNLPDGTVGAVSCLPTRAFVGARFHSLAPFPAR